MTTRTVNEASTKVKRSKTEPCPICERRLLRVSGIAVVPHEPWCGWQEELFGDEQELIRCGIS